jgi:hypothetical protein
MTCNVHLTFLSTGVSTASKNRKQNPNEYISKLGVSYNSQVCYNAISVLVSKKPESSAAAGALKMIIAALFLMRIACVLIQGQVMQLHRT